MYNVKPNYLFMRSMKKGNIHVKASYGLTEIYPGDDELSIFEHILSKINKEKLRVYDEGIYTLLKGLERAYRIINNMNSKSVIKKAINILNNNIYKTIGKKDIRVLIKAYHVLKNYYNHGKIIARHIKPLRETLKKSPHIHQLEIRFSKIYKAGLKAFEEMIISNKYIKKVIVTFPDNKYDITKKAIMSSIYRIRNYKNKSFIIILKN